MANVPIADILLGADSTQVTKAYANLNNITNFNELLTTDPINDATILAKNQIMHMVESWRYLASAINAFLKNSDGNAIHLAYYAELRAAISLYAGSGILIKNGNNAYINSSGNFQNFNGATYLDTYGSNKTIPKATHRLTWGLWRHWSELQYAKNILNKGIILYKTSPQNLDLEVISQKIGSIATKNLIQSWGVDLIHLTDDHTARNTYSYQPYWTNQALTKRNQSDVDYIKALWKLLLPQSYNQQGMHFDVALIKYVLKEIEAGRSAAAENSDGDTISIQKQLSNYLDQQLGIPEETFQNILKQSEYDLNLFQLASDPSIEVKNVLSRAVFLSRIAKLAVELNINAHSQGRAWILYWLEHCGIWDPNMVENPYDLNEDYEIALSEFNPSNPSFDIWHIADGSCPATMLSNPEACLSWNFSQ